MEERREEEWKQIPDYEGWYEISDIGNVKRVLVGPGTAVGKILKIKTTAYGYNEVMISKNGISRSFRVHRLVMAAFVGPCPEGYQVNHKDGNKRNNCLGNLEYVTPSENVRHAHRIGLKYQKGEKNNHSKLTEENVHEIKHLVDIGMTQILIAKRFNVSQSAISLIVVGKNWTHVKEPEDDLTNTEE